MATSDHRAAGAHDDTAAELIAIYVEGGASFEWACREVARTQARGARQQRHELGMVTGAIQLYGDHDGRLGRIATCHRTHLRHARQEQMRLARSVSAPRTMPQAHRTLTRSRTPKSRAARVASRSGDSDSDGEPPSSATLPCAGGAS